MLTTGSSTNRSKQHPIVGARSVTLLAAAMLGAALVSCSSRSTELRSEPRVDTQTDATTLQIPESRLVDRECDVEVEATTRCYWLEVPERRDVDGARHIRLWVAVVTPPGTPADAVPLLPLSGGPGNAASAKWVSGDAEFRPRPTPLVIVDQRGTGRSRPRLGCPHPRLADDAALPWPERAERLRNAASACRQELVEAGIDLDGFDSVESAADLVDLRRLLGLEAWDVGGVSYGGRLARELYRQDPEGVRSLHLDSPMPVAPYGPAAVVRDADDHLARLAAACGPRCGGDLTRAVDAAYRVLEDDPQPRTAIDGRPVTFDGDLFQAALRLGLQATELIPVLTGGVAGIAQGDFTLLDSLAAVLVHPPANDPDGLAFGTLAAVSCADGADVLTERDADTLIEPGRWSSALAALPWIACDVWAVDSVGADGLVAGSGDVPTLVTVGALDSLEPSAAVADVRTALRDVTTVVIPGGGHGASRSNACTVEIVEAFRADPLSEPDSSCVDRLPALASG